MRSLTTSVFLMVCVGIQARPLETRAPQAEELSDQAHEGCAVDKSAFGAEALGHTAALAQTSLRAGRRCFEKCSGYFSIYVCIAVTFLTCVLARCRKNWFRKASVSTDALHSESRHSVQVRTAFNIVHPPEQLPVTSTDVVSNLMRRFPERSREQVDDALRHANGHAGQVAKLFSRGLPNEQLALRNIDVVDNLMRRFPERSRQEVEDTLRRTSGHAGMAAAWFSKGEHTPTKDRKLATSPKLLEKRRQDLEDVLRTRSQRRGVLVT
eukprot:TRINITY_DN93036_c0_g1_i1.p1 TRINITY_DN93036_c0_g1~~TRINITY_DN93036_c0_g1_i1.p1  ORF type:complete len:267 (+),score=49.24 TRINITY_DN93036_c0_g1_i1:53-853(+)